MHYLEVLLHQPGREIPAVELASPCRALSRAPVSAQPVLDAAARDAYRARLAALHDELDGVGSADRRRTATIRDEIRWLQAELDVARGLFGRIRSFRDDEERARVAVGKAIRRAIGRVEDSNVVIGAALRSGVQTGRSCCYLPSAGVSGRAPDGPPRPTSGP